MNWQSWALFAERQFLASLILLHVIVTAWLQIPLWRPDAMWADVLADTLPFTQSILLVIWGVLGPGPWMFRLLAVPLVAAVYGVWTLNWGVAESEHVLRLLGAVIAVVLPIAAIARMRRLRLAQEPAPAVGKWQFSLRWLLGMMALSGVLVWVAQVIREQVDPGVAVRSLLACTLLALAFGLVSVICAWAILQASHPGMGLIVALTTAPLFGLVVTLVLRRMGDAMICAGWLEMHAVVMVLSLAPLRLTGYRLAPVPKVAVAAPAAELEAEQQEFSALSGELLSWPAFDSMGREVVPGQAK
jgi:hypothetical protein